jgi:hypothetical protein
MSVFGRRRKGMGSGHTYNTWFNLQMLQDPILRRAQERRRPVSFSVVPKVAAVDQNKNQDRNPHDRYPVTEEKGTVTSTAVAYAGGG